VEAMTRAQLATFRRLVTGLNSLLVEVKRDHPDAQWYLDGTCNLCLMSGNTWDDTHRLPRQDRILASEKLQHAYGGDW